MSHSSLPRLGRTLAGLTAVATCSAGLLAAPAPASAADGPARAAGARHAAGAYPNLAPRPPMGWNNWSYYMCDINEKVVLDNARALVRSGLARQGYRTVTVDDCWMSRQRGPTGRADGRPDEVPARHGLPRAAAARAGTEVRDL